jgi:hypothetical protein
MSRLAAALNHNIEIEDYLAWSTVISVVLFVPFPPNLQLGYVVAILNSLILIALNRLSIHRKHMAAIFAIAIFSMIGAHVSGVSSSVMLPQLLGITVLSVYYFSVLMALGLTLERWMELYIWPALAIALIGVALWPLSVLNGDGRLTSIYTEPSYYVYVTLPALGYCVNAYITSRRYGLESLIFLLSYACANSTLGFLGVILVALFTFGPRLRGWHIFLGMFFLAGAAIAIYVASFGVRLRVDQMVQAISHQNLTGVGATPFAILSNFYVTSQAFAAHPLVGAGIGSYSNLYDRYISGISGFGLGPMLEMELNKFDANSMILRVAAELGLPGLVALFGFMLMCARVKGQPFRQIRNAILPYLIIRTARMGAYFTAELYFFVGIYLLNYLSYRKTRDTRPSLVGETGSHREMIHPRPV